MLHVSEAQAVRFRTCRLHHVGREVCRDEPALGAQRGRGGEPGLARAGGELEDRLAGPGSQCLDHPFAHGV
jgi:hypothetical protein